MPQDGTNEVGSTAATAELDPSASTLAEGEHMHIHKPKPLHGFRETLGEIGIIVIGILIAIGLEQVVETSHWSHEVEKARASLHAEAATANSVYRYRIAASPCVERRLAFLEDVTERAASKKPVPKLGEIASNLDFALISSSWQAQRASQVLTHFDDEELRGLGVFFYQLGTTEKLIGEEATSWRTLEILEGDPARLASPDIANVRVALRTARDINRLIQHIAESQLDEARTLGLPSDPIWRERLKLACAPIEQVNVAESASAG
jgi:hypothetical protein